MTGCGVQEKGEGQTKGQCWMGGGRWWVSLEVRRSEKKMRARSLLLHKIPLPTLRNSKETFRISGSSLIKEKVGGRDRWGWVEKEGKGRNIYVSIYLYIWRERVYLSNDLLSCGSRVTGRPYRGPFKRLHVDSFLPRPQVSTSALHLPP